VVRQRIAIRRKLEEEAQAIQADTDVPAEGAESIPVSCILHVSSLVSSRYQERTKAGGLSKILIIHPGSNSLRIGRANDFYPHEVPNCIARSNKASKGAGIPPVPKGWTKRTAGEPVERGDAKRRVSARGQETVDAIANEGSDPDDPVCHSRAMQLC
jgi:hypothetical protein